MLKCCTIPNAVCVNTTEKCKHCGWNKEEMKRRKDLLNDKWLTPCEDGLLRLILPKVEREE